MDGVAGGCGWRWWLEVMTIDMSLYVDVFQGTTIYQFRLLWPVVIEKYLELEHLHSCTAASVIKINATIYYWRPPIAKIGLSLHSKRPFTDCQIIPADRIHFSSTVKMSGYSSARTSSDVAAAKGARK